MLWNVLRIVILSLLITSCESSLRVIVTKPDGVSDATNKSVNDSIHSEEPAYLVDIYGKIGTFTNAIALVNTPHSITSMRIFSGNSSDQVELSAQVQLEDDGYHIYLKDYLTAGNSVVQGEIDGKNYNLTFLYMTEDRLNSAKAKGEVLSLEQDIDLFTILGATLIEKYATDQNAVGELTWSELVKIVKTKSNQADDIATIVTSLDRLIQDNEIRRILHLDDSTLTPPVLGAVTALSDTSAQINWTDINGETGYSLERAPYSTTCGTYAVIGTPTADTSSYVENSLTGGASYCYRLAAINASGSSSYSNEVVVDLLPTVPLMQAVSSLTNTSVQINWRDSSGETSYSLERATFSSSCGIYASLSSPVANATSYNDTSLTSGITYCYRVKALNASGSSQYSATVQVTTLPDAPTMGVAGSIAENSVQINWTDVNGETGYLLERAPYTSSCGTYGAIASPVADAISYSDSSLTSGATYCYRIKASNGAGSGSYSSVVQVTLLPAAPALGAVSSLTDTSVQINWTDVNGETSYSLERAPYATSCGTYTVIGTPAANATSYSDTGLSAGSSYCYRLKGINGSGSGSYSSVSQLTTLLAAPASASAASALAATSITWSTVTGADSYTVFWGTSSGVTPSSNAITNAVPTYSHTGLSGGTTYYYRVAAVKSGVTGMLSSETSAIAYSGTAVDPIPAPTAGTYGCAQAVYFSSTTSGATIRYTTDGSSPSMTSGTIYSTPISVTATTTVKSIAYKSDYAPSGITSTTYTINANGCTFSVLQRSPGAEVIYGIGTNGATSLVTVGNAGEMLSTADGSTWSKLSKPTTKTLTGISLPTASVAYISADTGTILKSSDGGATWSTATNAGANKNSSIFFVDANNGYVVGQSGAMYKTTNGASSWSSVTTGIGNYIYSLYFIDANTGWIVASGGIIRKTTDGGANWTAQTSGTTNVLNSVFFLDANTGWVAGDNGTILKTTDGGSNWTAVSGFSASYSFKSIHFADVNNGWFVGTSGTAYKTTDGGGNWTSTPTGYSFVANSVIVKSSTTAYVGGDYGLLLKTTDGGSTWTRQNSGYTDGLYSIYIADDTNIFTVGLNGRGLRSTDTGSTWNSIINTGNTLSDIEFSDASHAWALSFWAGSNNRKSSDGGATWQTWTLGGVGSYLQDMAFPSASVGFIVGEKSASPYNNVVFKTTDSGANWTQSVLGTTGYLNGLKFLDIDNGWVAGDLGVILKTTDGGTNWSSLTSNTTSNLNAIDFVNSSKGLAVGNGGKIVRSTDGTSWTVMTSNTSDSLYTVLFLNDSIAWAAGINGRILQSSDGGVTWVVQPNSTAELIRKIKYYKGKIYFAAGSGIVLVGP